MLDTSIYPCDAGPVFTDPRVFKITNDNVNRPPVVTESTHDNVNHPAHYTAGGIECIDAIAAALTCHKDPMSAWLTGQVLKYLWRWPLKNGVEDLRKAEFYLNRLIKREQAVNDEKV